MKKIALVEIIAITTFIFFLMLIIADKTYAASIGCAPIVGFDDNICAFLPGSTPCPSGQKPRANCGDFSYSECPLGIECIPIEVIPSPIPNQCGYQGSHCCTDPYALRDPWCYNSLNCVNDTCTTTTYADESLKEICEFAKVNQDCKDCFTGTGRYAGKPGAWTAIGCVPTNYTGLVSTLLAFGIGIAGGVAFLLILYGGFQILTSAGNPEQLNAGRELIGSAVAGLLLIIFSIFLLRTISVDILGIPGFK